MKNDKLIRALKQGLIDIEDGYTDEAHFLFNKDTLNRIIHSLETIAQQSLSGSEPKGSTPKLCPNCGTDCQDSFERLFPNKNYWHCTECGHNF